MSLPPPAQTAVIQEDEGRESATSAAYTKGVVGPLPKGAHETTAKCGSCRSTHRPRRAFAASVVGDDVWVSVAAPKGCPRPGRS